MGKTLYLETSSGISGDMFVAAMIDLGADPEALERALNSIPADGFMVEISGVKKSGIACCDLNAILDAAQKIMTMIWPTSMARNRSARQLRRRKRITATDARTRKHIIAIAMRTRKHITATVTRTRKHITAIAMRTRKRIIVTAMRKRKRIIATAMRKRKRITAIAMKTKKRIIATDTEAKSLIITMIMSITTTDAIWQRS